MRPLGRILLVEDDEATRTALSEVLIADGHELDACSTGEAALEHLGARDYSMLLTDLRMPGMSGLELVRQARQQREGLRCVVVSGQEPPPESERCGATWLTKPLDLDRLDALIASFEAGGA
jgi:CheY-like chemotaxis protein